MLQPVFSANTIFFRLSDPQAKSVGKLIFHFMNLGAN